MNTLAVGSKLVELCNQGRHMEAIETLYASDIVSVEAQGDPTMPAELRGIEAIRDKARWWFENHEVHGGEVRGPYPHGDRFAAWMMLDVTPRVGPKAGQRIQIEEIALYTVKDGQ